MDEITRPTVMEVDVDAFKYNVSQIKKYIGEDVSLMPIIKAKAYGTYLNRKIDVLEIFDIVAVALVDEAIELRKTGYQKEIFVLNQPYKDEISKIIENNITVGVSSEGFIEELGKRNEEVKIHIEIGTGMGRTGIHPYKVAEFAEKIKKHSNIKVEGIYTHLSSADYDLEYTNKQLNSFKVAVDTGIEAFGNFKYIHSSASNGILNCSNSYCNLVRPGIILYGYESFNETMQKIDIKPVCKLKSKVTYLKEVKVGTSVGYSRKYTTTCDTKIATIPIGYADGLKRALSNKGEVVINGKKVPIIGSICMDSFMADVTNIEDVSVGDDVYIWDNENITVEDVAKACDSINYEIICTISDRVPRVFKM